MNLKDISNKQVMGNISFCTISLSAQDVYKTKEGGVVPRRKLSRLAGNR